MVMFWYNQPSQKHKSSLLVFSSLTSPVLSQLPRRNGFFIYPQAAPVGFGIFLHPHITTDGFSVLSIDQAMPTCFQAHLWQQCAFSLLHGFQVRRSVP